MKDIYIISINHRCSALDFIGRFHLEDDEMQKTLFSVKEKLNIQEMMYVSTCNRVEFILKSKSSLNTEFLKSFFNTLKPEFNSEEIHLVVEKAEVFSNKQAIRHLFEVASSLDSLVIGEREIITQVRNSFDKCRDSGLCGDSIRIVMRRCIETAKRIYTETSIARKPVSVVALAYHQLKKYGINKNARVLLVGSGKTNTTMARFLRKHEVGEFVVFNRTLSNAEKLADEIKASSFELSQLENYSGGFDILIACTSASQPLVTKDIFDKLINEEIGKKVVIDLGLPSDVDSQIKKNPDVKYMGMDELQKVATQNQKERAQEVEKCNSIISESLNEFMDIYKERQVEIAMRNIPAQIKEIHSKAINEVFAGDIQKLDEESKAILNRVLGYVEKKYISGPMKLAKSIMLEKSTNS